MVTKAQWIEHKNILKQKREHHLEKLEKAESERAKRIGEIIKNYRLKSGEDPYQWPVIQGYNRKVITHERVLEDIDMDIKLTQVLIDESEK